MRCDGIQMQKLEWPSAVGEGVVGLLFPTRYQAPVSRSFIATQQLHREWDRR
jgi:hypothetical protein